MGSNKRVLLSAVRMVVALSVLCTAHAYAQGPNAVLEVEPHRVQRRGRGWAE